MSNVTEVRVPDIGDFKDVEIIDVLVKPGDAIKKEDPLIALESDKATMEVPAPTAGTVQELKIKVGDKVSQGSLILLMTMADAQVAQAPAKVTGTAPAPGAATPAPTRASPPTASASDMETEVVVIGAGPGGYTAAFRAADLGKKVTLIERYPTLGGVCLNVGCIPSKALLHVAKVISEAHDLAPFGVDFGKPSLDVAKIQAWKASVVGKLTKGLAALANKRQVSVVTGVAAFRSANQIEVTHQGQTKVIGFQQAIIAAGSQAARIPGFPYDDPRLLDSTSVLSLPQVPPHLLVIGGGIIGLEMATVYHALGSKVSVVELTDQLIPGCDSDLVRPLHKRIEKQYQRILLNTKVSKVEGLGQGLRVSFEGANAPAPEIYDAVLVAVGRRPNGKNLAAERAGVAVNERGFIAVDKQQRTNVAHIYAIGDVVGEPMLAHKATHEAKVAAETIAGHKVAFDAMTIPSVAYTDPELAWMGLTERDAKTRGIAVDVATFPWAASGRSLGQGRDEGLTKLIFEKDTQRLLGAGMVGPNAGELVAEAVLALEMGADAADIALSIHPHPTLSETLAFAAEMAHGSITDLLPQKKNRA